jgi:hypothetical protein
VDVSVAALTACSGFLIAILWMDLIFDTQVHPHRRLAELPEPVLASIADYYRRATTTSRPMGHLIAVVMAIQLVTLGLRVFGGHDPGWLSAVAITLAAISIVLALSHTVPNAIRLGQRAGSPAVQTRRARSVLVDHVVCLVCQLVFLGLWLTVTCLATP